MSSTKARYAAIMMALAAALAIIGGTPGTAWAEEPGALTSNFEDHAGVVKDDAAALAAVMKVPGHDLWVVLVKNFNGLDAQDWAQQTYTASHLQSYKTLVAIATEDSEIGYWAYDDGISEDVLQQAFTNNGNELLELFKQGKWDDGVQLLGSNVATLMAGGSIASKTPTYILAVVVLLIIIAVIVLVRRHRKQQATASAKSLQELANKASSELLQVDDAVRSAAAELEFARAEFGLQATQNFASTLQEAQASMQQAFTIRTLLGDEKPETPAQQRQMYTQILQIVDKTRTALAAEEENFTKLRNLAGHIAEKLAELEQRSQEVTASLPLAQAKLEALSLSYSQASFRSLTAYPAQVTELLASVKSALSAAHDEVTQGKRNAAVPYAKLAEGTLDNAAKLIAKIDAAPQLLAQAKAELAQRIASLSADVGDAQRLGKGDPTIAGAQAVAESTLGKAHATDADLLEINEQLADAEADLDAALASVRAQEEVRQKLAQTVSQAQARAKSAIEEARNHINLYRAGIGVEERRSLALAEEAYARAGQLPLEEQEAAYRNARLLAHSAASIYRFDDNHNRSGGIDVGSMLAGMAISSVLNGLSSRGHGGGFSGGFGGGFGGGGHTGGRIGF